MGEVAEIRDVLDPAFTQRVIALVTFESTFGFNPHRLFQVDLDPGKVSPSRRFIRLDGVKSEVTGWFPVNVIEVVEILEEVQAEAKVEEPRRLVG